MMWQQHKHWFGSKNDLITLKEKSKFGWKWHEDPLNYGYNINKDLWNNGGYAFKKKNNSQLETGNQQKSTGFVTWK